MAHSLHSLAYVHDGSMADVPLRVLIAEGEKLVRRDRVLPDGLGPATGAMTRERVEALPDDEWRDRDARFQQPQLSRRLALVTPGAVAIGWTLLNPAVDAAIVGLPRPDQVDSLMAAPLQLIDATSR